MSCTATIQTPSPRYSAGIDSGPSNLFHNGARSMKASSPKSAGERMTAQRRSSYFGTLAAPSSPRAGHVDHSNSKPMNASKQTSVDTRMTIATAYPRDLMEANGGSVGFAEALNRVQTSGASNLRTGSDSMSASGQGYQKSRDVFTLSRSLPHPPIKSVATPMRIALPASPSPSASYGLTSTPSAVMPTPLANCITPRKRSPPSSHHSAEMNVDVAHSSGSNNPFFAISNRPKTPPTRPISDAPHATLSTPSMSGLKLSASPTQSPTLSLSQKALQSQSVPQLTLPSRPLAKSSHNNSKNSSWPIVSCAPKSQSKVVHSDHYKAIKPDELYELLENDPWRILVLDLRPHSAFASQGHLENAINLCVPSTLLRRPAYNLAKLGAMLPDTADQRRLSQAVNDSVSGSLTHLVALDQDSTALVADSAMASLLLKFESAGFKGSCTWLRGGYQAVSQHAPLGAFSRYASSSASSISSSSSSPETASVDSFPSLERMDSDSSATSATSSSSPIALNCKLLPTSAFTATSTQQHMLGASLPTSSAYLGIPEDTSISQRRRQSLDNRPASKAARMSCNPFFDSIRQNAEGLCFRRSTENVEPIAFSPGVDFQSNKQDMPRFLRSFVESSPHDRAMRAAREFFELESMEQKRLQDVMYWHANTQAEGDTYNPFSISCGIEKGHLNRYKHIFPFEHARCRLKRSDSANCDYVNASHIRFSGAVSNKSYIASQAPTEAAIPDFWNLVLQQGVSVIVMLTELREGGREKSTKYYSPGLYDDIEVKIVNQDQMSPGSESAGGFFCPPPAEQKPTIIRRLLQITHRNGLSRLVQHLQFGQWPDFGVPPTSSIILDLIEDANRYNSSLSSQNSISAGPTLVHCSAGVGRTGCFILIDVILHAIAKGHNFDDSMQLDNIDVQAPPQTPGTRIKEIGSRQDPAISQPDPVFAITNEMREQRMSMVANIAQYRYCYRAIVSGAARLNGA